MDSTVQPDVVPRRLGSRSRPLAPLAVGSQDGFVDVTGALTPGEHGAAMTTSRLGPPTSAPSGTGGLRW